MERTCYNCGSTRVARVVSPSAANLSGIRREIIEGKAIVKCGCGTMGSSGRYQCLDCDFEWDHYFEITKEQERAEQEKIDREKLEKE